MDIKSISAVSYNNNQSFKGAIRLSLGGAISDNMRPKVIEAVKNKIGEGLVKRKVGAGQYHDIFVGFNYLDPKNRVDMNEIIIATGNDIDLLSSKGTQYAQAKYQKVDAKIMETLEKILQKCGLRTAKDNLEYRGGKTGAIRQISPNRVKTEIISDGGYYTMEHEYQRPNINSPFAHSDSVSHVRFATEQVAI